MPSNAVDKPRPTRESLLQELEEIKASLMDEVSIEPDKTLEETAVDETHKNLAEQPGLEDEEIVLIDQELEKPQHVLPGQQSLFDEQAHSQAMEQNHQAEVDRHADSNENGENPFLPSHIRARLQQNKTSMLEDLADVGRTLARHEQSLHSDEEAYGELIDQLVAEYLPEIEKQLRVKLRERLHSELNDKK